MSWLPRQNRSPADGGIAGYADLLRPSGPAARPPQADPAYRPFGEVEIRDLAIYADLVEAGEAR